MEDNKNKIQIELSPEVAPGKYANLAVIAHSANEFIFDMICMLPNGPQARVQSRVIMTPENAKQLLFALQENISKYESTFGEIKPRQPKAAQPLDQITFIGNNNKGN